MVKLKDGSTLALTVTDSMVPMERAAESSSVPPSVVLKLTRHTSEAPGVELPFVGLISVGLWVVHEVPEFAEQPISSVTVVPAVTLSVPTVQVMVGALMVKVHVAEPAEKLARILLPARLLNAKVVADGEAVLLPEPGYVISIVPPTGIVVTARKETVCIAVMGVKSTSAPAPAAAPTVPLR